MGLLPPTPVNSIAMGVFLMCFMCFGWLDAQACALSGRALADGWLSPGEASEGAAEVAAVTAGLRLQAARLAHQQEQADHERRLAAEHQQQRRVLKEAAVAALAAGTLPRTSFPWNRQQHGASNHWQQRCVCKEAAFADPAPGMLPRVGRCCVDTIPRSSGSRCF